MDACGIIVAASEVIRLESGNGLLLTVFNKSINIHFYIFAIGNSVQLWKKVYVNHFYLFSHLKIGAVELLSGSKMVVLLTSSSSTFQKIVENQLQKCTIPFVLIKNLSVPGILFKSRINSFSQLISYQGVVTKVKNSNLGLYQLDNKVDLYCIFNSSRALLASLKEGSEVIVSNAHFLTDIEARKVLVCCGLSSVRLLQADEESDEDRCVSYFNDVHLYSLSIFDMIWLEALLTTLSLKFCPSVISCGSTFLWESEIMHNILENFSDLSVGAPSPVRQSVGDEYCSYPHKCSIFCDDILPTGLKVPLISEIVDKASSTLSMTANSDNWKTKCVQNDTNSILVGMFYLSKDGCWYVSDNSCSLPMILTRRCVDCNSSKNMLCSFNDLNLGYLVAVQNFVTVFEKTKYKSGKHIYEQYLKTSCCFLIQLGTFYKQKDSTYLLSSQENSNLGCKSACSVSEVTHMLEYTHLDKKDLWTSPEAYSSTSCNNKSVINNNASQLTLVLSKIWTVIDNVFVCYQILVLLLPHKVIYEEYHDRSRSLFEDSDNYYETDDDLDFAELVDRIDSLFLEDKPRLARLHFESAKQCSVLLPGHIYVIDFTENFGKDMKFHVFSDKRSLKPYLMKIKPDANIIHSFKCLGNHSLDDYKIDIFCNIKQIISERKVRENSVIRAILVDKLYEERVSSCGSPSDLSESMTLCLVVRDFTSRETIRVYLRLCPRNMYGFLPGVALQLYGFICVCSKRGNPYLTTSSAFAILALDSSEFPDVDERMIRRSSELSSKDLKLAQLISIPPSEQFKCLCFVIKITSAKLGLVCNSCLQDFENKCSCLCSYSSKLMVNSLIDDGTSQAIAVSSGEAAKNILQLSEKEWKSLTSYIEETRIPLAFNYKTVDEKAHTSSYINKVFCVLCSSQFLCRQMLLKCQKKYGVTKTDLQFVWCHDVLKIQETDLIPELIVKVKFSNTQIL